MAPIRNAPTVGSRSTTGANGPELGVLKGEVTIEECNLGFGEYGMFLICVGKGCSNHK